MPVPTKADFQRSTDLKTAISDKRAADTILNRIDALLDGFHTEPTEPGKAILLGKLYYATDAWLKKAGRGESGVNTRRSAAVNAFYVTVVHELSSFTGVPINLLPNWLTATFGKEMEEHGVHVDIAQKSADYLAEVDVGKFRLSFRAGMAYQQRWWNRETSWVMADTASIGTPTVAAAKQLGGDETPVVKAGFSGYVLSQGGDFYTGPHFAARANNTGRYHSSYFAGAAVLSAGEIRIERGHVLEINTDSGHYRPGAKQMLMAVETLAMHGVKLEALRVAAFGQPVMSGSEYLKREGLDHTPVDKFGVARPGWAHNTHGNTDLSRALVKSTLGAHQSAQNRLAAFALFKAHVASKANGGHGVPGRGNCQACKSNDVFWPEFLALRTAGKI